MGDRRRLQDTRMAGVYRRVRTVDGSNGCVYCGNARAGTWDHVYPVTSAAKLRDVGIEIDDDLKVMVRACQQCNSVAGSRLFKSFDHKRAFIREKLYRRYGRSRLGNAPGLPCLARPLTVDDEVADGQFD